MTKNTLLLLTMGAAMLAPAVSASAQWNCHAGEQNSITHICYTPDGSVSFTDDKDELTIHLSEGTFKTNDLSSSKGDCVYANVDFYKGSELKKKQPINMLMPPNSDKTTAHIAKFNGKNIGRDIIKWLEKSGPVHIIFVKKGGPRVEMTLPMLNETHDLVSEEDFKRGF